MRLRSALSWKTGWNRVESGTAVSRLRRALDSLAPGLEALAVRVKGKWPAEAAAELLRFAAR